MLHVYPDFYEEFHCLAGACPNSCCAAGWEVVVDEDTARRYGNVPGALGQALSNAMTLDPDGDQVIILDKGRCPFWTADKLCRIEVELGHDAPCETCRKFPRLTQDYGDRIEHGLTLGCPEAARLILTKTVPWKMVYQRDTTSGEKVFYDPDEFQLLLDARETLLQALWQSPERTGGETLGLLLLHSLWFQQKLDGEALPPWDEAGALRRLRAEKGDCGGSLRRQLLELHRRLDILDPQWRQLLDEAIALEEMPAVVDTAGMGRNLAADYLYRYWPQAINDWDCESNMYLLAVNWLVVTTLAGVYRSRYGGDTAQVLLRLFCQYAREVEHDDENREALLDALYETVSVKALLNALTEQPDSARLHN